MKKQKFSESQIVNVIKEHDAGKSAMDICRKLGVHKAKYEMRHTEIY